MNSSKSWYAGVLASIQKAPCPAKIGRIATVLHAYQDHHFGPWFQETIHGRYRDLTQPGLLYGPHHTRPHIVP